MTAGEMRACDEFALPAMLMPDEVGPLLAAVSDFAEAEIAVRLPCGSERPAPDVFDVVASAARAAGLLGSRHDEYGLWCEVARGQSPVFSLAALQVLAARHPALAWHLHSLAMGGLALQLAGMEEVDAVLVCDGRVGLGRSAFGRLLAERPLCGPDRELLADVYGDGPRLALLAPSVATVVAWHWRQGRLELRRHELLRGGIAPDAHPHGLEGCVTMAWKADPEALSSPLLPGVVAQLLAAQQLAQIALARGALVPAVRLAREYSALRVQGGRRIAQHDSVAVLLADIDTSLVTVDALLHQAAACHLDAATAISLRREAMPLLTRAANAVVQIHGGIGYMRDAGVEHVLRAVNCWRVLGGSPSELALVVAGMASDEAAMPEVPEAADHLPGHVAATHALSPLTAMRRTPLLRLLSTYVPRDPWETDTRQLPAALARLRRRVRDFAVTEIAPLAGMADRLQRDGHVDLPPVQRLLSKAGREGLLTDLLPSPLGSASLLQYRHALAWQQAIRVEELARVDGGLMLLLSAPALGLAPVLLSGDLSLMQRVVLPAFRHTRAGRPELFAFAITEPSAGSDAEDGHGALHQRAGVRARRVDGGWLLQGRKVFISGGDIARYIAVFAALEGEGYESWTCFLVDAHSPGFRVVRTELKMGMRASGAAELELESCFVPDAMVVGSVRNGWGLARATLNLSRLPVAAMGVGFAQQAVDIATTFACRETLAGRPLLHYQQVQSVLAELQAETSAIRALVWQHARQWTPRQDAASICKFQATDRAQVVIETVMDLLGNHAVTSDAGIERALRDVRLTRIFEGTNQINRLAVIEDQQAGLLSRIARRISSPFAGAVS